MTIYETFKNTQETVKLLPITFLMQMTQKSFPDEIFKIINEHPQIIKQQDISELTEAFRRYKEGQINLEEFIEITSDLIQVVAKIKKDQVFNMIEKERSQSVRLGLMSLFTAIKKVRTRMRRMHLNFDPNPDDDLITDIDRAIKELQYIKKVLMYGEGLLRYATTEDGSDFLYDEKGNPYFVANEYHEKGFNKTSNN
jgi:hypothetical protein